MWVRISWFVFERYTYKLVVGYSQELADHGRGTPPSQQYQKTGNKKLWLMCIPEAATGLLNALE